MKKLAVAILLAIGLNMSVSAYSWTGDAVIGSMTHHFADGKLSLVECDLYDYVGGSRLSEIDVTGRVGQSILSAEDTKVLYETLKDVYNSYKRIGHWANRDTDYSSCSVSTGNNFYITIKPW